MSATKKAAKKKAVRRAKADELAIHPKLAGIPMVPEVIERLKKVAGSKANPKIRQEAKDALEEHAPDWDSMVQDVKERGIVEEILVVAAPVGSKVKWLIVDGRHRYKAGLEKGETSFAIKQSADSVEDSVLRAMCQRNHHTKFQLAFFSLSLHPELVKESQGQRSDIGHANSIGKFASRKALGEHIRVNEETMRQAAEIHRMCQNKPSKAEAYRHQVALGLSYKGICAGDGAASSEHGDGSHREDARAAAKSFWSRTVHTFNKHWEAIESAQGPDHAAMLEEFNEAFLKSLPPALKEHLAAYCAETKEAQP